MPLKRVLQGGAVLVLLALVVLLVASVRESSASRDFVQQAAGGGRPAAPAFDLARLDGTGRLALADLRGAPVVVNFWASWCDPCKDEAPLLESLARELRPTGVRVVGIDSDDLSDDARAFARTYRITYDLVHDRGSAVKRAWGVTGFPETFVLDAEGRATAWFEGVIDPAAVREAVAQARRT